MVKHQQGHRSQGDTEPEDIGKKIRAVELLRFENPSHDRRGCSRQSCEQKETGFAAADRRAHREAPSRSFRSSAGTSWMREFWLSWSARIKATIAQRSAGEIRSA